VRGWDEHVGELQLWVTAPTEPEVFAEALQAVAELLSEDAPPAPAAQEAREVVLESADRAVLLADWIGELAFLAETDAFVADALEHLELDGGGLRARVRGHFGRPPHLVKAVTYHDLRFEPDGDGWRAQVVLDV
jgi:SHS2 domain-containing protein